MVFSLPKQEIKNGSCSFKQCKMMNQYQLFIASRILLSRPITLCGKERRFCSGSNSTTWGLALTV